MLTGHGLLYTAQGCGPGLGTSVSVWKASCTDHCIYIYRPTIRVLALECLHGTSRTAGSVSVRLSVGLYTVHPLSRPLRMYGLTSRSMFISKCIKSRDRTLLYPPHDRLSVCSRAGSVAYLPTRLRNHADGDFPLTTKVSQSVSI